MLNSKALKGFSKKSSKIYLWWIDSRIGDAYYSVGWFFKNPYLQIKKLIQWHRNVFHNDYDFDAHCLFGIISYKLRRVLKVLENGYALHDDRDMKALRLAIKLADRLQDDRYDIVQHERHANRWGEMKTWFTPTNDGTGSSYWNSSYPNANTPEKQEQERTEFRTGMLTSYARMKREEKWFYSILQKYMRVWWD